jgi:hypothetical protein
MRSGLYNYNESRELNETLDRDPTSVITPDELVAVAFKQRRHPVPGTQFEYSNPQKHTPPARPRPAYGPPLRSLPRIR